MSEPTDEQWETIFEDLAARNALFNFTSIDPTDPANFDLLTGMLDTRLQNIGTVFSEGLDLSLQYSILTGIGDIDLYLDGSYIIKYDQLFIPTLPPVGAINKVGVPIDLKLRSGAVLRKNGFGTTVFVNYADSYENSDLQTPGRVDLYTTVDWQLSYEFEDTASPLLSGTRISLSIQNLFDQDPPLLESDGRQTGDTFGTPIGFDPANADPMGRFFALEITKNW